MHVKRLKRQILIPLPHQIVVAHHPVELIRLQRIGIDIRIVTDVKGFGDGVCLIESQPGDEVASIAAEDIYIVFKRQHLMHISQRHVSRGDESAEAAIVEDSDIRHILILLVERIGHPFGEDGGFILIGLPIHGQMRYHAAQLSLDLIRDLLHKEAQRILFGCLQGDGFQTALQRCDAVVLHLEVQHAQKA